jgi:hypothetical protein
MKHLTDRQLLEKIYVDFSERFDALDKRLDGLAVQSASALTAVADIAIKHEATARRTDEAIRATREANATAKKVERELAGIWTIARERVVDVEHEIQNVKRRLAKVGA